MNVTANKTATQYELRIEGLRKGVGSTIGNFIRRAFLHEDSSTEVIGVRINDGQVNNQFQSISGVVEDSQALIANIQDIEFTQCQEDQLIVAGIMSSNASEVTASDLTVNSVQIINPDKHIVSKREETTMNIQAYLLNAKGFRSKDQNRLKLQEEQIDLTGTIVLDSNHKTIEKSFFSITEETSTYETLHLTVQSSKGGLNKVSEEVQKFINEVLQAFNG